MKRILLNNALEAWESAISYADDIMNGMTTLKYRKNFVASLHNATELFIKQRMLDTGDHSVCEKILANHDPDRKLQDAFNAATDLNEFFLNLLPTDAEKCHSANYSFICKKTDNLFSTYYEENLQDKKIVNTALATLKDLRNDETHFFIDKWTFLKESEFVQLYNFMIVFCKILQEYDLLPFWGIPSGEYEKLDFDKDELKSFCYKDALTSSDLFKEISDVLEDGVDLSCGEDSAFSVSQAIMQCLYQSQPKREIEFDKLWALVETAMHYDMIFISNIKVEETEDGIVEKQCSYLNVDKGK